jgi:hypothetical protein
MALYTSSKHKIPQLRRNPFAGPKKDSPDIYNYLFSPYHHLDIDAD